MEAGVLITQVALSIPITVGLVVYTLARKDRSPLHSLLVTLLSAVALWLMAMATRVTAQTVETRTIALGVEILSSMVMPPVFAVTMGRFARISIFERSRAAHWALAAIFACLALGFVTDPWHGLFIADYQAAIDDPHPSTWAGPLYWGFQLWCAICDGMGIGFGFWALARGRSASERRRATMVIAAILAPILGHFAHLLHWLPVQDSLAPGAIGATAIFFVLGVHRYGLLEGQAVVRHDVIESIEDALLLADQEGNIVDANAAAEQTIGLSRTALRGRSQAEVLGLLGPESDGAGLEASIDRLPLGGDKLRGELHTRDGRTLEISASAVQARGSEPAGRLLVIRDRTRERQNEAMLRERQKLESVGILAAGVAHEVNNPLAYVRSNLIHLRGEATELKTRLADEHTGARLAEFPEILDESIEGIDRIARIVESMLRFSRVSDESMVATDLNLVADEALRLAALKRRASVEVIPSFADALPPVQGSSERLVQVLLNLLLNAKQALAGQDDARIEIGTHVEGDRCVVTVSDNGPGVDERVMERLFDPFFTTRGPGEGTGLGLAIAFDIAREHRGALEVSNVPSGGACFSLRLPILSGATRGEAT